MGLARYRVRDLLLLATGLGRKKLEGQRNLDVEVTFTREYGYVVTKDGEIA